MKRSIWLCAASVLAAPILLSACTDPVEPAGSRQQTAPRPSSEGDQGDAVRQSLTASARIQGVLRCDEFAGFSGFNSEIVLLAAGGDGYEFRLGTPDEARYEFWRLDIADGRFTVTGEYIEGGPELKVLSLAGDVSNGRLSGEGMRGPRTCQLDAEFADLPEG